MTLTLTDLFCGAGGSSTGAIAVPGVSVRIASNHWDLAVETHNTNHPEADHLCADLSQIDPRRFPRTDILWASPECTNHSVAKGRKRADAQPDLFGEVLPDAAAERSRATMWDVPRFAEVHQYQAVIVENVVDAWHWLPFRAWLMAMDSLGYDHHVVFLNSMHAQALGHGAPQSRDRMYVVFWRKGNRRPQFEFIRPIAACVVCGQMVRAVQSWKRPDRAWGRYRAQYVFRCPNVACRNQVIEPDFRAAEEIIDWSLLGTRIGDRENPLSDKTMARVRGGIDKYWLPLLVPVEGREGKRHGLITPAGGTWRRNATSTREPIPTRTTRETDGIAMGPAIDINDVRFRMLEPREIARAMDFPVGYTILGNRREQVRQAGNAVTPPAARDLVGVVAESLGVTG